MESPPLPERYREPQFTVFDGVMPTEWLVNGYIHSADTSFEVATMDEVDTTGSS